MIRNTSRNSRSAPQPAPASPRHDQCETQTMMICTEVVDGTYQIDADLQGGLLLHRSTSTAQQWGQPRAEGSIEAFNTSAVDLLTSLCSVNHRLNNPRGPLDNPENYTRDASTGVALDDLGNVNAIPRTQLGPSAFSGWQRFSKWATDGLNVAQKAIHTEQQGPAQRAGAHLVGSSFPQVEMPWHSAHRARYLSHHGLSHV